MSTLNVTRALTAQTNPTEAQFDTMRTYLLNFFNAGNLDETNVAAGGMLYSELGDLGDDAAFKFTDSHGTMKYVSASDYFEIKNSEGDIVLGTTVGSTLTSALRFGESGHITVGGIPYFNTSVGSQEVSLLYMLSKYRKPRLQYTSADVVTAEDNTNVSGTVVIAGRDRFLTLYDTTMSLAVSANGYDAAHTGTAVSGLLASETRTANRWYFVYAVEVQGGTQADGVNCILVATVTDPETTNITTLNTAFGEGKWVYMGCIRNGYNDGTNTNVIVQFVYDEGGMCRFTHATVNGEGAGVTLASTNSTVNLEYEIYIGNDAAATMPTVASRIYVGGHRESHGMEFHYRATTTDENHAITGGCYHVSSLSALAVSVYLEVPLLEDYKFVCVVGDAATDQRIVLAGFQDHYV